MHQAFLLLLAILLSALAPAAAAAQRAERGRSDCPASANRTIAGPPRFALVIAVSDYDGDGTIGIYPFAAPPEGLLNDLPNPINDGNRMRDALCRLGFRVTLVQNPDKIGMETAIADFGAVLASARDAVALIYYSGHAIQVNGENWMVPSRARLPIDIDLTRLPEQVQAGYIGAHAVPLRAAFQYFRNPLPGSQGVNLVVIDACRNNPWYDRIFGASRSGATRGLADQPPPSRIGTLVAYSTSSGDVASDGIRGGNSPFTAALLELIEQPGLSIMDLLIEVRRRVYARTQQAPIETGSLIDRFCFAGCGTPPVNLAVVQPAIIAPTQPELFSPAELEAARATLRSVPAAQWSASWPSLHRELLQRLGVSAIRRLAEAGEPRAQFLIGLALAAGIGIQADEGQALSWIRRAAEAGESRARGDLGARYVFGTGVRADYTLAMTWLRRAADQGDANAESNIGYIYSNGRGVAQDDRMASTWYRRSAERGYAPAQVVMGLIFAAGLGVNQDQGQALIWFRRAAEQGEAEAQFNMGLVYSEGQGVARDDSQAMMWFRRAADQGHARAQYNIGAFYSGGRGVPQDYRQAFPWFLRAANQGFSQAQLNVGIFYETGTAGQQDHVQAVSWYRRASDQGLPFAQYSLGIMLYEGRPGVPANREEGLTLLRRAAAGGNETARNWLAQHGLPSS